MIDLTNILYTVLGGTCMIILTKLFSGMHQRLTGRNNIVLYSTSIKRHAHHHMEIEKLLYDSDNLNSIVMQAIDAVYIAVKGKEPTVAVLYLYKRDDALLFIDCLRHLDDPDVFYAMATRKKLPPAVADECSECKEFRGRSRIENTWFRSTQGRDILDEKVDEAMLEQTISLARSHDKSLSQSGACHIAVKIRTENKDNIVVIPTSIDFRKVFKKEYGTDDLARFEAKDLFDKVIGVRKKMHDA